MWPFRSAPTVKQRSHGNFGILIDANSHFLLTGGWNVGALVFLEEHTPGIRYVPAPSAPNYRTTFPLVGLRGGEFPAWTWEWASRRLVPTPAELHTAAATERSRLLTAKAQLYHRIMFLLSLTRHRVSTGLELQERVYMAKRLQAQRLKDRSYVEDSPTDYLFVVQYADIAGISLKQAADDILFKAKLDDEMLAQSELLRLTYIKRIAEASTQEELAPILPDFMRACFRRA